MSMKSSMMGLLAMAMIPQEDQQRIMEWERREKDQNSKPKVIKTIVPSGTKEYFFNSSSELLESDNEFVIFKCVAINEKNARIKLKKFLNNLVD